GRRATMVLALVLGALAMLHLGAARSPAHIAVAAFLLGMTGDMYRPAVSAAVADLVPPDQRTRAYGYLYWAVNLGFACAAAINGVLIVVLQPFALRIVHRFESSQVLAVACLLVGVGYGATQFVHTPAGYAATICIWTLGEIAFSPISPTVIADLSPPALRGT